MNGQDARGRRRWLGRLFAVQGMPLGERLRWVVWIMRHGGVRPINLGPPAWLKHHGLKLAERGEK